MKNYWKWILGIVIILVVLFGLGIGARLLMANLNPAAADSDYGFQHPMMGRGDDFCPFEDGSRFVGRMPYHGMHFGGGFMLLGWLFPLALVGLLAYGAYRLGMRKSPVSQAPLPPVAPVPVRTCTKCGQQIQDGWNNCANCGKKL